MPGPVPSGVGLLARQTPLPPSELTGPERETDAALEPKDILPFLLGVTGADSPGWCLWKLGTASRECPQAAPLWPSMGRASP